MYYMEMSIWLNNAINNLQEPTQTIVTMLLYICFPLILAFLVWLSNKIDTK